MPANVNGKRFELPALAPLNFSLTDGTDIPPPPDSPIEEEAPPPPATPAKDAPAPAVEASTPNGHNENAARGRPSLADLAPPLSPASTTSRRPSSIRRFLSRKSLNANYNGTNGLSSEDVTMGGMGRPESPASFMTTDTGRPGIKKVKSGSWFKRMTSSNRTSVIYENQRLPEKEIVKVVPMGPPPPKLPELNQMKAKVSDSEEGSLGGGDMFRDIK